MASVASAAPKVSPMSSGELAASGAFGDSHQSNVSSGAGISGGNGKGLASGVTGPESIDPSFLKHQMPTIGSASVDSLFQLKAAFGDDLFEELFSNNSSPFGIAHEGFALSNELTKGGLQQVSMTEQFGAKIQGNTGFVSQSGGQEH